MLDLVVHDATLVDGTGAPARRASVGVAEGRITAVGQVEDPARRRLSGEGMILCPGFIDIHTHYDAQILWDPTCAPSLQHGVTTIISGNCGLTLAPLNDGDESFLTRLLAQVESIPVEALQAGVSFDWRTFAEFLDVVDRALALNVGFLVGHSALRRSAMGPAASSDVANVEQIRQMTELLHAGIEAGGLGFSTSTALAQVDGDGNPTPPKLAGRDEFLALAEATGRHAGTTMEFIPRHAMDGFIEEEITLLVEMSAAANRSINWNALSVIPGASDMHDRQMVPTERAAQRGARVVPLMVPHNARWRMDFGPMNVGLKLIPGCEDLFKLDVDARVEAFSDPDVRQSIRESFSRVNDGFALTIRDSLPDWVLNDAGDPAGAERVGKTVAELAAERQQDLLDVVLDLAIETRMDVGFVRHRYTDDPWTWSVREKLLHDDRVVLGASDAGAHVDAICNAEYPTAAIKELVREREVFRIEELVRQLTSVPADLYGLHDRGRIAEGMAADLVLFDLDELAPSRLHFVDDFPAGAPHLVSECDGMRHVIVSGREALVDGKPTGDLPGRVLRSGRDTRTVAVRPG